RCVRAGAEAGRLLRAHHDPARRAALLWQRSDRRAEQFFRLPRAAAAAVSAGEAVAIEALATFPASSPRTPLSSPGLTRRSMTQLQRRRPYVRLTFASPPDGCPGQARA